MDKVRAELSVSSNQPQCQLRCLSKSVAKVALTIFNMASWMKKLTFPVLSAIFRDCD